MMQEAEQCDQPDLFKIRQSAKIKQLLADSFAMDQREPVGQGWEGMWSEVRLAGWTNKRRIIILRRPLRQDLVATRRKRKDRPRKAQMELDTGRVREDTVLYEYAVLVTNLKDEIFTWPNSIGTGATRRTISIS